MAGMKNDSGRSENLIWDRMFQLDHGVDVSRNPRWDKICCNTSGFKFQYLFLCSLSAVSIVNSLSAMDGHDRSLKN
jgi:hypothetical protein